MKKLLHIFLFGMLLANSSYCQLSTIEKTGQVLEDSVNVEWIKHYASDLVSTEDVATAITVDRNGNTYVTGYITNMPFGLDYLTVKYDSLGNTLWEKLYNGDGNGDDLALAIAIDSSGNVYVTGQSYGVDSDYDYCTIKYTNFGIQEWVLRYNGPENSTDKAVAIDVDSSGNVYITGESRGIGTYYDYATIKYTTSGIQQWIARYSRMSSPFEDRPTAISVDGLGNAYITGMSFDLTTKEDYATIKYSSSGIQQWVARYNGAFGNYADFATAITIDKSGGVFVTGYSFGGANSSLDYLTIKYNNDGIQKWLSIYNASPNSVDKATAITVDGIGNVYVTGSSSGTDYQTDYATIKYDTSGVQIWENSYDGPAHWHDEAVAISVDVNSNVYVSGWSYAGWNDYDYASIKYDSTGIQEWEKRYTASDDSDDSLTAMTIDQRGNVYITGTSFDITTNYDYTTIKYTASGTTQWVARTDGPGNSRDNATAITLDNDGNVYVTGKSHAASTDIDYATIKYNAMGMEDWVTRYNGPENDADEPTAISVSATGNVYVTGRSRGIGTSYDYTTVKYDDFGVQQWVARYNGPGNSVDNAYAIDIDKFENIYITGASWGGGSSHDIATVKYDAAGVQQWVARYNGPGNNYDWGNAIVSDNAGNIYITGGSYGISSLGDYVTIKYNDAGGEEWVARYNGPGINNNHDRATAIALDDSGNVYVTGQSSISVLFKEYATLKYNAAGVEQWAARYHGPANGEDRAIAIDVDTWGNIYVTGLSWGVGTGIDYATIKYNSAGIQQWEVRYNGPANNNDIVAGMVLDNSGNVYVTGQSEGNNNLNDFITIKYNPSGFTEWIAKFDNPEGNYNDRAVAIVLDTTNNVYVTGTSSISGIHGQQTIYSTIKYSQITTALEDGVFNIPFNYSLSQNYPNPFNPMTQIRFSLPNTEHVLLQIFNPIGQKIVTLVDDKLVAGNYEIQWNASNFPSGIYFYRIRAGKFTAVKKMVIVQ